MTSSGADSSRIALGSVLGAFGVKGWIRIRPHGTDAGSLLTQRKWELSGLAARGDLREVQVEEVKEHAGSVLARIAGIDDRDGAEALRGAEVMVRREQLPAAEPGEYYWADLIGLAVRNVEGVELGTVSGLIAAPAHDVLRVAVAGVEQAEGAKAGGQERLIPFVEPIVRDVDLAGGTITVDWQKDY
jgi:16S rRNA processing protein RimM